MRRSRGVTLIELIGLIFFVGALCIFVAGLALTRREQIDDERGIVH